MSTAKSLSSNRKDVVHLCLFLLFVSLFIVYKLYYIGVPYFWDESWVYGPAVSEMGQRLPSLLSGSIDIDLSRGHPMLFHFLGGLWGNIFGISVSSLHVFSLSISVILLYSIYYITRSFFTRNMAFIAVILLIVQSTFLAQSAMVLPEVLVALFALWSIHHFTNEQFILSAIFASLCLLTKESGVVLMPVICISYFVHTILLREYKWKRLIYIFILFLMACMPYLIFLYLQNKTFGWYFFPNHVDLQSGDIAKFQAQLRAAFNHIFVHQGRIAISIITALAILWKLRRNVRGIIFFIISSALIGLIIGMKFPSFTLFSTSCVIAFCVIFSFIYYTRIYKKHHFLYLTISIFFALYLLFTAYNFFSARYLLVLLPLFILVYTQSLHSLDRPYTILSISLVIALICAYQAMDRSSAFDTNQSYVQVASLQKEVIEYMEELDIYDTPIFSTFLVYESLSKKHAGYRSTDTKFQYLNDQVFDDKPIYTITSSVEGIYFDGNNAKGRTKETLKKFERGNHYFIVDRYSVKREEE